MSQINAPLTQTDAPVSNLQQLVRALQKSLPTRWWLLRQENTWQHDAKENVENAAPSDDLWPLEGSPFGDHSTDAADHIAQALNAAELSDGEPIAIPIEDDWYVLCVLQKKAQQRFAVACLVQTDTPEIVVELASLAAMRCQQQQQMERLQQEFEVCAAQISDDFEELSFLRSIAQQLECSDLSNDLIDMAQTVLPLLQTAIKAQTIVLMLPDPQRTDEVEATEQPATGQSAIPAVWCGATNVSKQTCREIVNTLYTPQLPKPVVKNVSSDESCPAVFPGVEALILAPITKAGQVMGWLLAINRAYRQGFENAVFTSHLARHEYGTPEAALVTSAASMLASQGRNAELFREREELLVQVVRTLVCAIEAKDPYTCGHSERVALYARRLAKGMGMAHKDCERIYLTGLLHDIGKIGVSDATLRKPGRLTDDEFAEIKTHPDKGWSILIDLNQLRYVMPGVVHHHERVDGRGYPDGLVGDDIPLDGRVLAVADAYDAMTSDRPYRDGMPVDKAYAILNEGAGTQWDANMIEAFNNLRGDIETIQIEYDRPIPPNRHASLQQN